MLNEYKFILKINRLELSMWMCGQGNDSQNDGIEYGGYGHEAIITIVCQACKRKMLRRK